MEHDTRLPRWMRAIGFSREFSRSDTWITSITVLWPLLFTLVFVGGTAWAVWSKAADAPIAEESWLSFWEGWTWLVFATGCVIVVWFTIGGFRDLRRMYAHLGKYAADARDDGTVRESREERPRDG